MKKSLFFLIASAIMINIYISNAFANEQQPIVSVEVPATTTVVKTKPQEPSKTSKAIEATKDATKKSVDATKDFTGKAVDATKDATRKSVDATKDFTEKAVDATKDFTNKAVKATKDATKKSVDATKTFTNKTVENTKEAFENINPNKPVTLESLQGEANIKKLKNEKKELKAAYNSRIKDINAKIKATEKATNINDVQKQNKIYLLNKEKNELILQRNSITEKYDKKIKDLKNNK